MSDLLICWFSIPGFDKQIAQPVQLLNAAPKIVGGPQIGSGGSSTTFGNVGQLRGQDGRLLPNLLDYLKIDPGSVDRIGSISFSAGRAGAQQLLVSPEDRAALDVVIDLDGIHFARQADGSPDPVRLREWVEYGKLCFDGSHLLACLHTSIVPGNSKQITSTTESNAAIFRDLSTLAAGGTQEGQTLDTSLLLQQPPPAVTINSSVDGGATTYDGWPQTQITQVGNCFEVGFKGGKAADHIFAAYYGQGGIWRSLLVPRWNGSAPTTRVDPGTLTASGSAGGGGSGGAAGGDLFDDLAPVVLPAVGLVVAQRFGLLDPVWRLLGRLWR